MNQFQKTVKYTAMAFAVFLAVTIISGIVGLVLNVISVITGVSIFGNQKRIDIAFDLTGVESLDVDHDAGNLIIKTGDTFRVEGEDVSEGFIAEVTEDGTLRVYETNKHKFLGINFNGLGSFRSKVTVYLPEDFVAEKVILDTGLGNTTVEALRAEELTISAGVGNIRGYDIVADNVKLDGGLGNCTLTGVSLRDADIDCGLGGLRIEGELLGNNKIDCGVGGVNLDLIGSRNDYSMDVDAGLGSVQVNGEKLSGSYSNVDARHSLKVDGGVGQVNIDFNP